MRITCTEETNPKGKPPRLHHENPSPMRMEGPGLQMPGSSPSALPGLPGASILGSAIQLVATPRQHFMSRMAASILGSATQFAATRRCRSGS